MMTPKRNRRETQMKDYERILRAFFSAYDAHDIDGMLAFCAEGAQGRYLPYGRENIMPLRGGIEAFWRGFAEAVPDFAATVVEVIPAEGNVVVVQATLGGTMPTDIPGLAAKGQLVQVPHAYILRFTQDDKIAHVDCYWDNAATSFLKASAL
jgi:steroid delta-isomerase-like uncharacterized protein